jgi:hypothetical protein
MDDNPSMSLRTTSYLPPTQSAVGLQSAGVHILLAACNVEATIKLGMWDETDLATL